MAFRSEFTELMTKDMYGWFWEVYDTFQPVYPMLFETTTLDNAGFDKMTTGVGMGKLSERDEGNDIQVSNPLEGFTAYAKMRSFSDGFYLPDVAVDDAAKDKTAAMLQDLAKTWAQGVIAAKESFAAQFFNYGFYTAGHATFNGSVTGVVSDPSGDLCYDSKPFFAASGNDRTAKSGSTYYNSLGASALSSANLQTAYNLITNTNNRSERNEIVQIMPDTLLIPPALRFTAKTILESELVVGSANNDINVTQNLVTPIEWQYLTDTDAWFLAKRQKGIKWYDRKAPVIDFFQDEISKKYYATIDARWGAMVYNWRYWVGANGSTS